MQDITKKHTVIKYFGIAALYAAGPLFLATTNPDTLALPFLVLPFVWLFASIAFSAYIFLVFRTKANKRQSVAVSFLLASVPVLLLVFQSIHQLTIKDVLLSVGLASITAFYILRADFIK